VSTAGGARAGPAVDVPLRYLATAAGALVAGTLGIAWLAPALVAHYYQPRVLALVHVLTLGWITFSIVGASYQLVPVIAERPLWSERLARWQYWWLLASLLGMIAHFAMGRGTGLAVAAAALAAGLGAHGLNVARSLGPVRPRSFAVRMIALAHVGLALAALAGVALAANRLWHVLPVEHVRALHAHVQLALLGWVVPMILGVASRAYPMFLLAPEPRGWPGPVQLWGLAVGVPAVAVGIVASRALLLAGALAVTAALASHLVWVTRWVRERRRPALDWGLTLALGGSAALVPATALGWALALGAISGSGAAVAFAAVALGGWVSLTIAGMMLKIVPFLVWYRAYAPRVGRGPVPTLAQLSSPALEAAAGALLAAGVALVAASALAGSATAMAWGGGLAGGGALTLAASLGRTLLHLAGPAAGWPGAAAARPAGSADRALPGPAPRSVAP
jgi:hypothetical protein